MGTFSWEHNTLGEHLKEIKQNTIALFKKGSGFLFDVLPKKEYARKQFEKHSGKEYFLKEEVSLN